MKRGLCVLVLLMGSMRCLAQSDEAVQLLLNVEKLAQFKQILADLKKGYQIVSKGYSTIKDLSQGNFSLHQVFLDGLMQVSPAVRKYQRVADIIQIQLGIAREYKAALKQFRGSRMFTEQELTYLAGVYDRLIRGSLQQLDELTTVLTANQLRMSDDERIAAIDRLYAGMQKKQSFLRSFNNSTKLMALERMKQAEHGETMNALYGIKK